MSNPPPANPEPTLYRLELDDDVEFWVAAHTAMRAIDLARETEPMLFAESRTLLVVPHADRAVTFRDDRDGGTKTIRDYMAEQRARAAVRGVPVRERIIACSEWA